MYAISCRLHEKYTTSSLIPQIKSLNNHLSKNLLRSLKKYIVWDMNPVIYSFFYVKAMKEEYYSGQVFGSRLLRSGHNAVSMTNRNQSYLHWLKFRQFQVLDRGLVKFQLLSFFLKVSNKDRMIYCIVFNSIFQ